LVCPGCRARLHGLLDAIAEQYAALDTTKGRASTERISGSRTPPLPLRLDPLDLALPPHVKPVSDDLHPLYETTRVEVNVWRPARPTDADHYPTQRITVNERRRRRDATGWLAYGPSGDQIGEPGVAAVLDTWARDWQTHDWAAAMLPTPQVEPLLQWLDVWLDRACDHHRAIDDFAAELRNLLRSLRRANGLAGPSVTLLDVPCRRCDWLALAPVPRQDRIECLHCGDLASGDEYGRWTRLLASGVRDLVVDFDLDVLLYVDEAALLAKVTQNTVRLWVKRGVLPVADREYGRPRFLARDVLSAERRTRSGIVAV
jgi:hypothetical protein